jgi:transposase
MKKIFIGIDFSKETFDVSVLDRRHEDEEKVNHAQFENNPEGYAAMLKWIKAVAGKQTEEWLFCGEHTGLYSVGGYFLVKKELYIWLENPLQIKLSGGIKREKSDEANSLDIAQYASRYLDRAKAYRLPDKDFTALQNLLAFRERLVKNKVSLQVSAAEMRRVYQRDRTARSFMSAP